MATRRFLCAFAAAAFVSAQAPAQQGGGACTSAWDCALAGVCETNGTCVCDAWSTGPQCDLLNLAPPPSQAFGLQVDGYHSWGGHALPDPNNASLFHGFFSFLCNHSTLGAWTTKSAGFHATASAPEGPYTLADMVVQPWSHNMMISQAPGGPYLLWQVGDAVAPPSEWAPCYEPASNAPPPERAGPRAPAGSWVAAGDGAGPRALANRAAASGTSPSVKNGQVFLRSAPALTGPWTPFANNTGVTVDFGDSWVAGNGASGNPAPFFFPNGSLLLYFTGSPCPDGWGNLAPNCIGAARADAWDMPLYTMAAALPLTHPESEDPFVFRDQRGNFHMLTNVNTFHVRCASGVPCGGHAWSYDGLAWSNLTVGAFGPVIRVANASGSYYWSNSYVERPQVLQAADGTPRTFFVGIGRTSYMDSASWAQPFCSPGQSGCGPTHPPQPTVVQLEQTGSGQCLSTNATFPCPGGWANSCPVFLGPCDGMGSAGAPAPSQWLEHPDGSLESAVHPGNCLNFDCDECASGTLAKVVACSAAAAFSPFSGSLLPVSCPGMCVNDGRQAQPANPPCKPDEFFMPHGQLNLQACGAAGTTGWQRIVVELAAPPRSARWHYHWRG